MGFKLSGLALLIYCAVQTISDKSFGEECIHNGQSGTCTNIVKCPSLVTSLKKKEIVNITTCSAKNELICCADFPPTATSVASTTTEKITTTSTTPSNNMYNPNECPPIQSNLTAPSTGEKAWDKCLEYQANLIYPCREGTVHTGGLTRTNRCYWKPEDLIIGGKDARRGEFPHMALLGYGTENIEWVCGGTIISERFIITAGHCTSSAEFGTVTKIKVGVLDRSEESDSTQIYDVKRIIPYPLYMSPSRFNDIALLETDGDIQFSKYVIPACLHTGFPVDDENAIVMGWGTTQVAYTALADRLQKVVLQKFPDRQCKRKYKNVRQVRGGLDLNTQVCYGTRNATKDSCRGDSGGPAILRHPQIHCMYTIMGVTSFGKSCAMPGWPGVYMKIEPYVLWIERMVWP